MKPDIQTGLAGPEQIGLDCSLPWLTVLLYFAVHILSLVRGHTAGPRTLRLLQARHHKAVSERGSRQRTGQPLSASLQQWCTDLVHLDPHLSTSDLFSRLLSVWRTKRRSWRSAATRRSSSSRRWRWWILSWTISWWEFANTWSGWADDIVSSVALVFTFILWSEVCMNQHLDDEWINDQTKEHFRWALLCLCKPRTREQTDGVMCVLQNTSNLNGMTVFCFLAVLYRVRRQKRPPVPEAEQKQRDDGSQVQTDDHQEADHPEHRYRHAHSVNTWLGPTAVKNMFVCVQTTGWTLFWGKPVKLISPSSVLLCWTRRRLTQSWRGRSSPASSSSTPTRWEPCLSAQRLLSFKTKSVEPKTDHRMITFYRRGQQTSITNSANLNSNYCKKSSLFKLKSLYKGLLSSV